MAEEKPLTQADLVALKDYVRHLIEVVLGNSETWKDQDNSRWDRIERELKLINRRLRNLEKNGSAVKPDETTD